MQQIIGDMAAASSPSGRSAKIRFLVINPISKGAILRAVADATPVEYIGSALQAWTWDKHISGNLYNDVHTAIRRVKALNDGGADVEIRLSASDLPFAMLMTHDTFFIEQYALGRSKSFSKGVVLGGEFAVYEHEREGHAKTTSEERIVESAFEVLWDSCSMSAERYIALGNEKALFEAELKTLKDQLDPEPNPQKLTMVILAAGYGVRFSSEADRIPALQGKPKALLPVKGRPMLEWLLECVKDVNEIGNIVLVTNEKYFDQFEDWRRRAVERRYHDIRIISDGTNNNSERRGAIGALHFAVVREAINNTVLVVGADNFFAGDFKQLIQAWQTKQNGMVVVHNEGSPDRIAGRLGVVTVDNKGQIIDFEEKPEHPKSCLASTLCYLLTADNLRHLKAYVRERPRADNSGEFIRHLVKEGAQLDQFEFQGMWFDVGTLSEYESLCKSV
jgi:glucose-1-phosphate thymidylyltransferase